MKLFCKIFGHKGYGIRRIDGDSVTCFCSRCHELFEYTEVHFFDNDTKVFIPKGAIDIELFKTEWDNIV